MKRILRLIDYHEWVYSRNEQLPDFFYLQCAICEGPCVPIPVKADKDWLQKAELEEDMSIATLARSRAYILTNKNPVRQMILHDVNDEGWVACGLHVKDGSPELRHGSKEVE